MGVLGDERNPVDGRGPAILVCNHYGCPIKAGYAEPSPFEKGDRLDFVARRLLLLRQFYISRLGREPTPVLIGTRLIARRRFRCPVIKFDSSSLMIKVDLLDSMCTHRLIKFQLRSLAIYIHIYICTLIPALFDFRKFTVREKRWRWASVG